MISAFENTNYDLILYMLLALSIVISGYFFIKKIMRDRVIIRSLTSNNYITRVTPLGNFDNINQVSDIVPIEAIGILVENTVENIPVLEGKVIN